MLIIIHHLKFFIKILWYNISCFFLIIFFLFFNPTFHFLESSLSSFFSFSFFRLVFSPPHTYPLFSYVSTFLFLLHAWIPVLVFSSSSVLTFLFLFSFLFGSLHAHTADHVLLTSPLCLHFCFLFSFFFISLHSNTQPAERVGLRLSLFSDEKRESFFLMRSERESKEEREKKIIFYSTRWLF